MTLLGLVGCMQRSNSSNSWVQNNTLNWVIFWMYLFLISNLACDFKVLLLKLAYMQYAYQFPPNSLKINCQIAYGHMSKRQNKTRETRTWQSRNLRSLIASSRRPTTTTLFINNNCSLLLLLYNMVGRCLQKEGISQFSSVDYHVPVDRFGRRTN